DDERAVHALVDVPFERSGVAMVEMATERVGVELVGEHASRRDGAPVLAVHPVHLGGMETMEVHGVWMCAAVGEVDAQAVALDATDRGSGHPTVVGPGREEDPRRDLDLLVDGRHAVGAHWPPVRGLPLQRPHVPIDEHLHRVETVAQVIDLADQHLRHRDTGAVSTPDRCGARAVPTLVAPTGSGGSGGSCQQRTGEQPGAEHGSRAAHAETEEAPPRYSFVPSLAHDNALLAAAVFKAT